MSSQLNIVNLLFSTSMVIKMIDWNWDLIVSLLPSQETISFNWPIILFNLVSLKFFQQS